IRTASFQRMNFLLHRHLAARDLGSPSAAHGAMLPDLWRIVDRRVRATEAEPRRDAIAGVRAGGGDRLAEVMAGIAHHLEADRWFHASAVFSVGERATAARFREAGFFAPRMGLLGHVAWELLLDGALVRRLGVASL